jgi:protein-S-isoprenylcysteine O-methyltransferase Ste14
MRYPLPKNTAYPDLKISHRYKMQVSYTRPAPAWARALNAFNTALTRDLFGGPRRFKLAWAINLHKFLTAFVVALLMIAYHDRSTVAWVYLALHGAYGFCWLLKHLVFRDSGWEVRVTFGGAAATFLLLDLYWIAPWLLVSGAFGAPRSGPSGWYLAACIAFFTLGLAFMLVADCQKYFTLQQRRGLITTGMYRYIRHPNYLGEMMLYAALAMLVRHWLPWLVLAFWWLEGFLVNMLLIEESLSRYPEWDAYRSRTGMLLPWRLLWPKRNVQLGSNQSGD